MHVRAEQIKQNSNLITIIFLIVNKTTRMGKNDRIPELLGKTSTKE